MAGIGALAHDSIPVSGQQLRTEMCSSFEAGPYLRLIDIVFCSTLGLRVIKKKKEEGSLGIQPHVG